MSEFRKIYLPKSPCCNAEIDKRFGDYDYGKLVSMATGSGTDNVILKCTKCGKPYRVTCTIKYNVRTIK